MSKLEEYLDFLEKLDVELLALYALDKINNPEVKEIVERDLEKFEELKANVDRKNDI